MSRRLIGAHCSPAPKYLLEKGVRETVQGLQLCYLSFEAVDEPKEMARHQ